MNNDVDYIGLGRRIRLFRVDRGMTQEQLAEKAKVGRNHLAHIETGKTTPSLAVVVRIANSLKVSLDYLMSDSLDVFADGDLHDLLEILDRCSARKTSLLLRCMESLRNTFSNMGIE